MMYWTVAKDINDLKIFLFLALVAMLFDQAKLSGLFWYGATWEPFLLSYFGQMVQEFSLEDISYL